MSQAVWQDVRISQRPGIADQISACGVIVEGIGGILGRVIVYKSLKGYISMDFEGLQDLVVQMFAGARCKADISMFQNDMSSFKSRDDVLAALVHLGYLSYDADTGEAYVPNEEVRTAFARAVRDTGYPGFGHAVKGNVG